MDECAQSITSPPSDALVVAWQEFAMDTLDARLEREEAERLAAELKKEKEEERQRRTEYFITIKPRLTAFRVRPCSRGGGVEHSAPCK